MFEQPAITPNPEKRPLNKDQRNQIETEQEIDFEERKLETFANVIGDSEYYICGGLALELATGKIKYRHEDIDIIIFTDKEEKIKKSLAEHGFEIYEKPRFQGHDLEAKNFQINEQNGEIFQGPPAGQEALYIGMFRYKKNQENGTVQQLEPDGSVSNEFPISYFDREHQTIDHNGKKLTIADLRRAVSFKLISERPKDLQDVQRIMPLLKSQFSEQEISELKEISKRNIEMGNASSLKYMFESFLETKKEFNAKNIYEHFSAILEKKIAEKKDPNYSNLIRKFLEEIKEFSPDTYERNILMKNFLDFSKPKMKEIEEYQYSIIDSIL
jgi:hypothetical protein